MTRFAPLGVLCLSLGLLSPHALAQGDGDPGFGDLSSSETTTVSRTDRRRVFPLDTERLDADMEALRGSLDEAFELWAEIVAQSERTYVENNGLQNIVFHFWDDGRFAIARQKAAELQRVMSAAQGKVTRINDFFAASAATHPELYTQLLERHASVLELVTLYNTLVDWGTIRSLDFDTAAWGDESELWILRPEDFQVAGIPAHPRIELREQGAVRTRTTERTEQGGVVQDRTVVQTRRTVFLQALDPQKVRPWLRGALESADAAAAAKAAILGSATQVDQQTLDFSKRRILVQDQETFDASKRQAAIFAEAMARMKARRNAAYSLLTGSDLLQAEPNLRADWVEVERRFEELAGWGDAHHLQYDRAWTVIERNHTIFQQAKFADRHLFVPSAAPAVDPEPASGTGTGTTSGAVSYDAAYRTIRSRNMSHRYDTTRLLIPRIRGLTLDQLNALANLNYDSKEDDVVRYGMQYVTR